MMLEKRQNSMENVREAIYYRFAYEVARDVFYLRTTRDNRLLRMNTRREVLVDVLVDIVPHSRVPLYPFFSEHTCEGCSCVRAPVPS